MPRNHPKVKMENTEGNLNNMKDTMKNSNIYLDNGCRMENGGEAIF